MSTSTLLHSVFKYEAWANGELFVEVGKLDPVTHEKERHTAIRLLDHIHVVDRIFAAHLSGRAQGYTASNTQQTPMLAALRDAVVALNRWYVDYTATLAPERFAAQLAFTVTDGATGAMRDHGLPGDSASAAASGTTRPRRAVRALPRPRDAPLRSRRHAHPGTNTRCPGLIPPWPLHRCRTRAVGHHRETQRCLARMLRPAAVGDRWQARIRALPHRCMVALQASRRSTSVAGCRDAALASNVKIKN
jgi:hypothetical protein